MQPEENYPVIFPSGCVYKVYMKHKLISYLDFDPIPKMTLCAFANTSQPSSQEKQMNKQTNPKHLWLREAQPTGEKVYVILFFFNH
jgi:hypothetical protein